MLFISHDLAVIRQMCDRVAVMYGGRLVETGPANEVFESPLHPYTKLLLSKIEEKDAGEERPGDLKGCRFFARCPEASEKCARLECSS